MNIVFETLKSRYSYARFQWLTVTLATISALYLSSDEIWRLVDNRPFPEITTETIIVYTVFFSIIIFLIHVIDVKRIVLKNAVAVTVSIISMGIDWSLLGISEFLVLWAIQVLPNEPLRVVELLLIGVMPSSLGVVTLSSLTVDVLKKRASKLREDIEELKRQIAELDEKRKAAEERHKEFEKKRLDFEEYFKKEKTGKTAVNQDEDRP